MAYGHDVPIVCVPQTYGPYKGPTDLVTGFEPIIAKNVQKINFKFTMISIFTTLCVLNK